MRRSALAALLVTSPWLVAFRWEELSRVPATAETAPFDETTVVRALEDPSAETRVDAATQLGRHCSPASAEALARHIDDESEEVRLRVVRGLSSCAEVASTASIVRAVHDASPAVRLEALRALATLGDASTLTLATEALADDSEDVRIGAIEALGAAGGRDAVLAIAAELEEPRSTRVVDAAFASLVRIGSAESFEVVLGALVVPAQRQRARAAIESLRTPGDETQATLVRLVASRLDVGTQDARNAALGILTTLARRGSIADARDAIARRFERERTPIEEIARLFAMSSGADSAMPLLRMLASDVPQAAENASVGIEWLAEHDLLTSVAIEPVFEAFSRATGQTSERLFSVLARLGAPELAREFERGAASATDEAVLARLTTLARNRYALPLRLIERFLYSPREEVRAAAFVLLGEAREESSTDWVAARFADPTPIDRVSLADALRRLVTRDESTSVSQNVLAVANALLANGNDAQKRDAFVVVATHAPSSPSLEAAWSFANAPQRAAILLSFGTRERETWVRRGLADTDPRVRAAALFAARGTLGADELRTLAETRREARFPEDSAAAFVLQELRQTSDLAKIDSEMVLRESGGDLPRTYRLAAFRFADGSEIVLPADAIGRVTLRDVPRGSVVVSDPFAAETPMANLRTEANVHTP